MKSLNDIVIKNNFPKFLTDKDFEYIISEGFKLYHNNSCCYTGIAETCYFKNVDCDVFCLQCYIFENAIGLDVDYKCGGNYTNYIWKFSEYSFEQAYDFLVDMVNNYR